MAKFVKGQSGNPNGRPRKRRPYVSAFDIILDKTLTVSRGNADLEHSVSEVLELKTYQAALGGSRMAVRQVLKMIEKREAALSRRDAQPKPAVRMEHEFDSQNADEALLLLGIAAYDIDVELSGYRNRKLKLCTWAAQAGISRPGRAKFDPKETEGIERDTIDAGMLRWPRGA